MITRKLFGAIFIFLVMFAIQSQIRPSGAQNKEPNKAQGKTSAVRIQEEKGPGGHSTIGIVENSIEGDTEKAFQLTFSRLMNWEYNADDDTPPPEKVARLDGRKITLTGFMYPLQQGDSIQYFCLLRTTQTCCYGPRPQFNQYVLVEMSAPTPFYRLDPVSCVGKFSVEPTPDEGYIYRLEGEKCESIAAKDTQ